MGVVEDTGKEREGEGVYVRGEKEGEEDRERDRGKHRQTDKDRESERESAHSFISPSTCELTRVFIVVASFCSHSIF